MSKRTGGRRISQALLFMVIGGLCGAGVALFYAPSSGDGTRRSLRMKTEWARRRAGTMAGGIKETVDRLVAEMRVITAQLLEGKAQLPATARTDLLSAIESGKKAMDEERKRLGQGQTRQQEHDHNTQTV